MQLYYRLPSISSLNYIGPNHSCMMYVLTGNGKVGHVNQANNMYLFPGFVLVVTLLHYEIPPAFILVFYMFDVLDLIQDWSGFTSFRCSLHFRRNAAGSC